MKIPVLQADTVEILVDNFFDVFEPSRPGIVERVIPGRLKKPLVAAHGLAYLITLNQQGKLSAPQFYGASGLNQRNVIEPLPTMFGGVPPPPPPPPPLTTAPPAELLLLARACWAAR